MKTYEKENGNGLTLEDMATMIRKEGGLCRGSLYNKLGNRCFIGVIDNHIYDGTVIAPLTPLTEESRYEIDKDFYSCFRKYPEELNDNFRGTNKARAEYMARCCEKLAGSISLAETVLATIEYYDKDRRERNDEHELGVAENSSRRFHE